VLLGLLPGMRGDVEICHEHGAWHVGIEGESLLQEGYRTLEEAIDIAWGMAARLRVAPARREGPRRRRAPADRLIDDSVVGARAQRASKPPVAPVVEQRAPASVVETPEPWAGQ
jgi:hypothetical protein